jgi:membrane-associated protein
MKPGSVVGAWKRLSVRRRLLVAVAVAGAVLCVAAAVSYMADSDGLTIVQPGDPRSSYLMVFLLVALDAVIPVFPGETTLNVASTAAAAGTLDLGPVIVMGALGAIVGDSALFWLARHYSHRIRPQVEAARRNGQVRQALEIMDSSAPVLIIGGRYVPGLRFVVNATMGLSTMPYRRFLPWSALSGILWSAYTCLLAYYVGLTLGDFPMASVVISGLVTTVAIAVVFVTIRRRRRAAAPVEGSAEPEL